MVTVRKINKNIENRVKEKKQRKKSPIVYLLIRCCLITLLNDGIEFYMKWKIILCV